MRVEITFDRGQVDRAMRARARQMAEQVDEVMAEAAQLVADRWESKVPVGPDPTRPPGRPHYRDAIHIDRLETPHWVTTPMSTYLIGAGIPSLPWWLEFGTSKMAAHPSARPAVDETAPEMIGMVRSALGA